MRKAINISAILFFVWLVLDAFRIPDAFLNFLLVGALPGTDTRLAPSTMLAIMTVIGGLIIFDLLVRKAGVVWRTRRLVASYINRRERLPSRRFGRI